jgi:hypothetical protein
MLALLPHVIAGLTTVGALEIARTYLTVGGATLLATAALLSYGIFVGVLLCLPFGQPIVRRAWHLGMMLTQGERAAT